MWVHLFATTACVRFYFFSINPLKCLLLDILRQSWWFEALTLCLSFEHTTMPHFVFLRFGSLWRTEWQEAAAMPGTVTFLCAVLFQSHLYNNLGFLHQKSSFCPCDQRRELQCSAPPVGCSSSSPDWWTSSRCPSVFAFTASPLAGL